MFEKCRYPKQKNAGEDFISSRGRTSVGGHILNISEKEKNPQLIRQKELLDERLNRRIKYPILTPDIAQAKERTAPDVVGIKISDIVKNIRTSQKPNVLSILDKMIRNNLLWNRQGELVINARIIKNSNIIKLMKFLSGTEKVDNYDEMPIGVNELWETLSEIEVPTSWIKIKPLTIEEPHAHFTPGKYLFESTESSEVDDDTPADDDEEEEEEFHEAAEKIIKKEKSPSLPHVISTKKKIHKPTRIKRFFRFREDPDIREKKENKFRSRRPNKWEAWSPARVTGDDPPLRKSQRTRKGVSKLNL